jgi:hypothetical protein
VRRLERQERRMGAAQASTGPPLNRRLVDLRDFGSGDPVFANRAIPASFVIRIPCSPVAIRHFRYD